MRDSVALGSYVDSRRAFSDSQAWLRKSTRLKPREEHVQYLLVAGCKRLGPRRLPDRSPFSGLRMVSPGDHAARQRGAHSSAR